MVLAVLFQLSVPTHRRHRHGHHNNPACVARLDAPHQRPSAAGRYNPAQLRGPQHAGPELPRPQ
jgi:hypothetical protein